MIRFILLATAGFMLALWLTGIGPIYLATVYPAWGFQ